MCVHTVLGRKFEVHKLVKSVQQIYAVTMPYINSSWKLHVLSGKTCRPSVRIHFSSEILHGLIKILCQLK